MEKAVNVGLAASPSSSFIPKNYVSLRQLRDLRLKEKQDEEERLRNLNLHLNQQHQQTEGRRLQEDYLSYHHLNPTKGDRREEGESKLQPKPPGSKNEWSPIGFKAVARPEPARRPEDDGPEENVSEADLKCVIGDAVGDPKPPIGQICNQTRKTEKKRNEKKKKGKVDGEKPERLEAMLSSVSVNPKRVSLENAIQLKEGGGPGRWERAKQKPAGLQCSGSEQMMQIEKQSINGGGIPTARDARRSWSAPRGGRSFPSPGIGGDVGRGGSTVGSAACPRPGRGGVVGRAGSMVGAVAGPRPGRGGVVGRGGSMAGAAAGLVWVKKTAGS